MIIDILLILPIVFSLILFLANSKKVNNLLVVLYSVFLLISSIGLCFNGNYSSSLFENYFKLDSLNIIFLLILAVVFLGVVIYNHSFVKTLELSINQHKKYFIGLILFVFSMTGAILSNHLGLSWIFIEATTLTSAYLIYFSKTKHALEAAWKYVFICSIGISLAFIGIILLLIGLTDVNSLFFDSLYLNADKIIPFWLKLSYIFILIGFGTKVGLAPVHSWLPDAHSESPAPISALLSATLLNSAFLIILRYLKIMELAGLSSFAKSLLLIMGLMSVAVTAVYVFNIKNYKRMLAYSSIENMGIAAIGVAVGGFGVYAAIFQLIAHSLIKSSFFLTSGNILNLYGTKQIKDIKGLVTKDKTTGWLWILCFIGIAGLPPSALFLSEFLLIKEMFLNNQIIIAILFLLFLTIILYGIGKVIIGMSFGETPDNKQPEFSIKPVYKCMYIPQIIFISIALTLGVYMPSWLEHLITNAVSVITSI